jgi:hypothetical protein
MGGCAISGNTGVVDDDVRAVRGERQHMCSTDPAPAAGDDGNPPFEHRRGS